MSHKPSHEKKPGTRLDRILKTNVWEVVAREDGTFDIFRTGQLLHSGIPDQWLEAEIGRYGFCGDEYREIRRQLDTCGKATIRI